MWREKRKIVQTPSRKYEPLHIGDLTAQALLFCGANAYKATHLESVKEVIDSLMPPLSQSQI